MFEKLVWLEDRVLLGELVFRLEHRRSDQWELGEECFGFYKVRGLISQYERAFGRRSELRPSHVLELGMWDGGSLAFWFEILRPEKIAGVDLADRSDSPYFLNYVSSRGLEGRVRPHWGTNQADAEALRRIVEEDLDGAVDLIFDDASHLYEPTRSSFETLFPLLPEGGLYIIEDWAWAHWKSHASPDHPWAKERPLTQWIFELVEAIGSSTERIQSVEIHQGIAIIERGRLPASEFGSVHLKDWISRRQPPIPDLRTRVRSAVGRLWPA